jgi:hypothetical protein
LASLDVFGYPSNLIARFYSNPAFGVLVQRALVEFDKGNQIGLAEQTAVFASSLGRTQGAVAPSEFWYFWRQFFHFSHTGKLSDAQLKNVDISMFLKQLGEMEAAFDKPLAMKGMILNWNIPYLARSSEKFFFVDLQRDSFAVAQSILESRVRYAGSRGAWWSFKPPEYRDWLELDPIDQVAAQVVYTKRAISEGLSKLEDHRKLVVNYAEFCEDPALIYKKISEKYKEFGELLPTLNDNDAQFRVRYENRLNDNDSERLIEALADWEAKLQGDYPV